MRMTKGGFPKAIGYTGPRGNPRSIHLTRGSEKPYEARFDGGTLGYYLTYDEAYAAIQAALEAKLQGGSS